MIPGIEQRHLTVRDGTRIGYQVRGSGPAVVLANGLGGTYIAFKHLYEELGGFRTICWDYRGVYSSGPATDPTANTIVHQVDDLEQILAAEGIDEFFLIGWSMGVQVSLETIRRMGPRVRGLYAINGTSGRAFHTVLGSQFIGRTIPAILKLIKAQAGLVGKATNLVAGRDIVIDAMKAFGMVAPSVDVAIFREVAAGFRTLDWAIYSDLLARLDEHDATDMLGTIRIPTTIVTGKFDIITPPATAEAIHRAIPGSRLVMLEKGTHYTPVEFPDVLRAELRHLLGKVVGWGAPPVAVAGAGTKS